MKQYFFKSYQDKAESVVVEAKSWRLAEKAMGIKDSAQCILGSRFYQDFKATLNPSDAYGWT